MTPCPSKASALHPNLPVRYCVDTCARYAYACHLSGDDWLKPRISGLSCINHVPKVRATAEGNKSTARGEVIHMAPLGVA